jgi:hypothetical protein
MHQLVRFISQIWDLIYFSLRCGHCSLIFLTDSGLPSSFSVQAYCK